MRIIHFFDKLEDKIRGTLSRRPLAYGLLGGIALVLFWRGVWLTADMLGLSGVWSLVLGAAALALIGLLVSSFIGDQIILSGVKQEKKLTEKAEGEIKTEMEILSRVEDKIEEMDREIHELKK